MSIGPVVTRGFGSGGSIPLVVTRGYGGAAAPEQAVVAPTTTPAGAPVRNRRRYIMPDGTILYATTQEAYEWLRQYTRAVDEPAPAKPSERKQRIVMPRIELERRDVRFVPATDSIAGTYKAVISERFVYRPPDEATRHAQERINRMRADDEAILVLTL